jgi:DNA-binding transcriptional regulator YdaS (Cro superfamily)
MFNTTLKLAILEQGLKQRAMARTLQMSESKFSQIVHGWQDATAEEKKAIARILKRKVHDLFPDQVSA